MKQLFGLMAAASAMALAAPATAANFSFTGNLPDENAPLFFAFNTNTTSLVTLVSWSYAGGVNAAGNTIANGGFDPQIALFRGDGTFINNDDDSSDVRDPVTRSSYDVRLEQTLTAGDYIVALTAFPLTANRTRLNFANPGAAFDNQGAFDDRSSAFALDILGVNTASVPEPAAWAMMLSGFGMVGYGMRRRSVRFAAA